MSPPATPPGVPPRRTRIPGYVFIPTICVFNFISRPQYDFADLVKSSGLKFSLTHFDLVASDNFADFFQGRRAQHLTLSFIITFYLSPITNSTIKLILCKVQGSRQFDINVSCVNVELGGKNM